MSAKIDQAGQVIYILGWGIIVILENVLAQTFHRFAIAFTLNETWSTAKWISLKKIKKVGLIENAIDNSAKNKSHDVSFI